VSLRDSYSLLLRAIGHPFAGSSIAQKLLGVAVALFVAGHLSAQTPSKQDIEAARQEYEQAVPPGNEKARLTYVTKLAQIADRLVSEYRRSGQRNDELMGAINSELQKHPAPKDIDSKKLSQLLVGKWESPRRTYVYRANGKCGTEDGPISGNWQIQGNQLIQGDLSGPIILLNQDYFIYSSRGSVFFHSRVKG
jgi:hypothetical protein